MSTLTGTLLAENTIGSADQDVWVVTVNGRSVDVKKKVTIKYNGVDYTYSIMTWMGNISDREISLHCDYSPTNIGMVRKGLGIRSCAGASILRQKNSLKIVNLKEPLTWRGRQELLSYGRASGQDLLVSEIRANRLQRWRQLSAR